MNIDMNPRSWLPLPDIYTEDPEVAGYLDEVIDDTCEPRFNIVRTDDGWVVEATVKTAGACSAVSGRWLLPMSSQDSLEEAYGELEEVLVWEAIAGATRHD